MDRQNEVDSIARVADAAVAAFRQGWGRGLGRAAAAPPVNGSIVRGVSGVLAGRANSIADLYAAMTGDERPCPALPPDDRRELALVRAIVLALIDSPCESDCHDPSCEGTHPHPCHLETCLSEFGVPLSPERHALMESRDRA
jgi:hypothetical protein